MTAKTEPKIWMILGSTNKLMEIAPGMVMNDIQRFSKFKMTLLGNLNQTEPSDQFISVQSTLSTRFWVSIISKLPYRMKKFFFMTSHEEAIEFYLRTLQLVWQHKPNIIIVHVSYALCWLIKWVAPKTEVVYYHHGGNMHLKLSQQNWLRMVKACPQLIISVSQAAIDGCKEKFDSSPQKMAVVYNGVNPTIFKVENWLNKNIYFDIQDPFVFCFAGRINFSKGVHILLAAFKKLVNEYPHARLLLIGEIGLNLSPEERQSLQQEIDSLSNHIRVTKKIPKNQVASYMSLSDVSILFSQKEYEGNSLFAIESLYLGIPLILSNKGGNKELIDPTNPVGTLIDVNEDQTVNLYKTMARYITDQSLYMTHKHNAEQHAQKCTIGDTVKRFDQLIQPLVTPNER